jgi:putative ABC transport system permease protein
VIVDEFFLQQGGGPPDSPLEIGDTVQVRDPQSGRTRALTVEAIAQGSFEEPTAFMGETAVRELFGAQAVPSLLYVATRPGVDPQRLADRLDADYLANGADAVSFERVVREAMAQQQQFFQLMRGYLALGLVVGIAGLGVVMVRAVRERRRQIGVLRSLGFDAAQVRRAFVVESSFVALEGIAIGVVLAVVSSWRVLSSGAFGEDIRFTVPLVQVASLVLFTFVASLLATAAPARQASRIRPAVALRIAD